MHQWRIAWSGLDWLTPHWQLNTFMICVHGRHILMRRSTHNTNIFGGDAYVVKQTVAQKMSTSPSLKLPFFFDSVVANNLAHTRCLLASRTKVKLEGTSVVAFKQILVMLKSFASKSEILGSNWTCCSTESVFEQNMGSVPWAQPILQAPLCTSHKVTSRHNTTLDAPIRTAQRTCHCSWKRTHTKTLCLLSSVLVWTWNLQQFLNGYNWLSQV